MSIRLRCEQGADTGRLISMQYSHLTTTLSHATRSHMTRSRMTCSHMTRSHMTFSHMTLIHIMAFSHMTLSNSWWTQSIWLVYRCNCNREFIWRQFENLLFSPPNDPTTQTQTTRQENFSQCLNLKQGRVASIGHRSKDRSVIINRLIDRIK